MTTGWPPGMLQDDSSELSRWLSNRLDARHIVRKNLAMTHYTPTQVRELADSYKFPGNRTAIVLRELADQVEALTAERECFLAAGRVLAKVTQEFIELTAECDALQSELAQWEIELHDATIDAATKEPK